MYLLLKGVIPQIAFCHTEFLSYLGEKYLINIQSFKTKTIVIGLPRDDFSCETKFHALIIRVKQTNGLTSQ